MIGLFVLIFAFLSLVFCVFFMGKVLTTHD